jgi:predicted AlkP superfamily pyrophosphatase or phosphodiesterase
MTRTLPDYAGGSIANLMRTLADACGAPAPVQAPLAGHFGLDASELSRTRNIVLLIVDGLGAGMLEAHGRGELRRNAGKRLTSVFPSTTAAAIPTFMTGLAPAQHALTGWHMWLDELQAVTAILPLTPRSGPPFAEAAAQLPGKLFDHRPIYSQLHRAAWVLSPRDIALSPFNVFHTRGADTLAYGDLDELMSTLGGLVRIPGRKFIYAYWPTLDSVSHRCGTNSREARDTLARFCTALDALLGEIAGSDTRLLVSADHGFIDSPESRIIELEDHPHLAAMLARPLCGEQRVAWCYLKPDIAPENFLHNVHNRIGERAEVVSCERLVAEGWFGPGEPHPRLRSRIGDFALLMRDNWTIKDWLPGEKRYRLLGQHGGISADEMLVPLVDLRA